MSKSILEQPLTLESLSLHRHKLRLAEPLSTAAGTFELRETTLLCASLRTPDGRRHRGFGEAAPLSGWTPETPAGMRRLAEAIEYPVEMHAVTELEQHLPQLRTSPVLRFGVELAILDALARAVGISLGDALHRARTSSIGESRRLDAVPVQFTMGVGDADTCIRCLTAAYEAGHTHAKLKVGVHCCDDDLMRLRRVVEHCPPLTLRLDANGGWTPDQALYMLSSLPRDRIEIVEQPVADEQLLGLLERYDGAGPRIAADESCANPHRIRALISSGRLGAIVLKPSAVGGLLPAAAIFDLALERGVQVIISNLMESAVGRRAITHLASAWPELPGPHGLATGPWLAEDVAPEPDHIEQGKLVPGRGPGLGFLPAGFA